MGKIDYRKIYNLNKDEWKALTREPQKYEALLAGHYSESNHFVYELLQNAEDAHATKVVIEYNDDKLVFYHNGKSFDEDDVKGVSSMIMGTKDRNDATTIGKFGMGFKSVFKYTYQPEIYSNDEAFRIENYLLPVEITGEWNYIEEKERLVYKVIGGGKFYPFSSSKHLTKFIIPFEKKKDNGTIVRVQGNEVLTKLKSLTGETLLFLTYIKNLYWVDNTTGKFARIALPEVDKDKNLITCRMEGTEYGEKEEVSRYLKYRKVFDHPDMKNAEVSVAYKVNNRANNINEMSNTDIWVYFPTRDNTELPFLIHGSFATAVSREKLMTPSTFNDFLFDELGNLIADSLIDLKSRKMITQVFIRRVLLGAFKDEEKNHTILGLKEKVSQEFLGGAYLPDRDGEYRTTSDLFMAVPFGIADFYGKRIFENSFLRVNGFVAFNNERESNFTEYFNWLINDLDIRTFTLDKWAKSLVNMDEQQVYTFEMDDLNLFYNFLSDNRESLNDSNLTHTRSGPYERMIKNSVDQAWNFLKKAPIILNAENTLIPAFKGKEANIYLGSSSKYKSVLASALVCSKMSKNYPRLFDDGFQINEFDNLQYIKEKIVKKYVNIEEQINFDDTEHFEKEYVEDISQILRCIEETHDVDEIRELLKKAYIIKIRIESDESIFNIPSAVHVNTSEEGIDLNVYYAAIPYEAELDDNGCQLYIYKKLEADALDTAFYEEHRISVKKLQQLGLITTPIQEGKKKQEGIGDGHWTALGEYCPNIKFDGIEDNFSYIQYHSNEELAKRKSIEILKLMLASAEKLQGKVRYRKNNPYEQDEKSYFIRQTLNIAVWLYTKDVEIVSPTQISKYDLDKSIYGNVNPNKEKYEILGFKETDENSKEDAFEMVGALDKRDKKILLKQLARELGMHVGEIKYDDEAALTAEEEIFNPDEWISSEFPIHKVQNIDGLLQHVREQFFCADPVKYQPILRQIRVSKSQKMVRSYVLGMYTNESNVHICQMCKEPSSYIDVTEIANYGIELPQLNLCLCRNCSSKYKEIRDINRDNYKYQMKQVLKSADLDCNVDEFAVTLNSKNSIFFTQTHLAEVQVILSLIDEYGLPSEQPESPKKISDSGAKVNHKVYGNGIVSSCLGDKITVDFDNGRETTFDLKVCQKSGLIKLV